MKILNDYYTLIFIIFAVILIGLLVINYLRQNKITKALIDTKYSAKANIICNVRNNKRYVYLTISNKSLSDATISSFGFQIGVKKIDFSEIYKIQKGITVNKITVPARGFIEMYVSVVEIEKLVKLHITNKKPEKVSLFVVDGVGNIYISGAKCVNAVIKADAKDFKLGVEKVYERNLNDFTETETYAPEVKTLPQDDLVEEIIEDNEEVVEKSDKPTTEEKVESVKETVVEKVVENKEETVVENKENVEKEQVEEKTEDTKAEEVEEKKEETESTISEDEDNKETCKEEKIEE